MEEVDKGCLMVRMGVSGWIFLLVPACPGSPDKRPLNGCSSCSCCCRGCCSADSTAYNSTTVSPRPIRSLRCHTLPVKWLVATWAEFQHSVVYYATDQCQKRLEACINAEGGQSEHLLWHCLPDIPVATHHHRFFSEPPTTTHNWLSSEPPMFGRMGWASGLQVVFLWDNADNQKCVWIIMLKMTFGFPKVKWLHLTGEVDSLSLKLLNFSQSYSKIKGRRFGDTV